MKKFTRTLLITAGLFFSVPLFAQKGNRVKTIDFIKIINNNEKEALFFYKNNWKVFRDEALKKKYITSYEILKTTPDSSGDYDLILITEYADSSTYALAEKRFGEIIANRKTTPQIKQNIDNRKNFVLYKYGKEAEVIITSKKK